MDESLQFRIQGFSLAVCRFSKGFILSALQRKHLESSSRPYLDPQNV